MSDPQQPPPWARPQTMPTAHPTPIPSPPKRPVWPIPIGVISIVLGGLGIICTPFNLANAGGAPFGPSAETPFPEWFKSYGLFAGLVGLGLAVVLLAGGICLLRRRPAARNLHLTYGWVGALMTVIGTFVAIAAANSSQVDPGIRPFMIGGALFGALIGLAYPIFVLIWFSRAKIVDEVNRWRRELDAMAMGQQSHPM